MTKLALKDVFFKNEPVIIDDYEIKRGDAIETIYLIDYFVQKHPTYEFWFLLGTDHIEKLSQWDNEGDRLINEVNFLLFERPGFD